MLIIESLSIINLYNIVFLLKKETKKLTNELTACSSVLLVKLTGSQLVKKFRHFVEAEGSLPHSQEPITCP
jgi:hypothetical protein